MILEYNLQFFADGPGGEKTEPATEKKKTDARKDGKVAKSKEIANCAELLAAFVLIRVYVGTLGNDFLDCFQSVYNLIPEFSRMIGGTIPEQSMAALFKEVCLLFLQMVAPVFLVGFAVSFIADVVQVQWKPTAKPLQPKFNKLNPLSGFKRIFSKQSLVELIKSLVKFALVGYVAYSYIRGQYDKLYIWYEIPLKQAVGLVGDMVVQLGIRMAATYVIIAAADFAYQKWKYNDDLKMTKQEVKDEYKQQEGDPQIKGKIRQRMQESSRRRMMQDIPKADVVITNPTHFAVAIRYDNTESDAPVVVAKGSDYLAQKIKEIARDNHVEIIENKPLARTLYANVDIGQAIPPELYQAVAEVLAYVYHLQGKA